MKTEEEGSLTIFSALSLLLILSFLLALLEGARVSGLQMMDTLAADTGMDCVAAEYQTVLWDKYHLLYLDGAYGWDQFDENKVSSRVMDYVAGNLSETGENSVFRTKLCEASLLEYMFATDNDGTGMLRQASAYMKRHLPEDVAKKMYQQYQDGKKAEADGKTEYSVEDADQAIINAKKEKEPKIYGEKKAVDDLSLHIRPGEIYGFIGHNGAGKTTTIKACCGILNFEEGNIQIDGISVKENPLECKKKLAYIPDNPDLYDFMTGIRYLNFIADIFGVNANDRQERIHKYADMFELTQDLAQPISAYSHGMKQKLAIISALIHEPKLIIMDEPFVGLDPKASHLLKETMHELCATGTAIFFSTHVLEVAEKLCDKVAIIKEGRLICSGTMEEVKGDASLEEVFLEMEEK